MSKIIKAIIVLVFTLGLSFFILKELYVTKMTGSIVLPKAPGVVRIIRETDTQIAHIIGDSFEGASYGQGFAHAQTRLWQLQMTRLIVQGRLAEFFGSKVIVLDKFMRNMGFYRLAQESVSGLHEDERAVLQAYCNGINDFVSEVSLMGDNKSASLFPPEFYLFGMTDEVRKPFTIADALGYGRLISFQLTWNWHHDLQREALRQAHPDLAEMAEELLPFTSSYMGSLVTVLAEEDLHRNDHFVEETLDERYQAMRDHVKKASPKLDASISQKLQDLKRDEKPTDKLPDEVTSILYGMAGVEASNNWAVHGNFTVTGKPLFGGDPHLGCKLPAFWQMMEVSFLHQGKRHSIVGGSIPGVPAIIVGHSLNMAWSTTSPHADNTDLWQEHLSEDGLKYQVDGEWRDLKVIESEIRIKGEKAIPHKVRLSHRGPLMESDLLYDSIRGIFNWPGNKLQTKATYSLGWGGFYKDDHVFKYFLAISTAEKVPQLMARFDEIGKNGYFGVSMNFMMADTTGNIGYMMLLPTIKRKDRTPFIGSRVLDGTVSAYDWEGHLPITANPRSLNPSKGFLTTANNRQVPDNAATDTGAGNVDTPRSVRIDEFFSGMIASGHKITLDDIMTLQQDQLDTYARSVKPLIIQLSQIASIDQQDDLNTMLRPYRNWDSVMSIDSVGATIHQYWELFFYKSMFKDQIPANDPEFGIMISATSISKHFFVRMFRDLIEDPKNMKYNRLCRNGYPVYSGDMPCVYNIARSFIEAKKHLEQNVSPKMENWVWGEVMTLEFVNQPWSSTPLKPIFHRSVKSGGNENTVNVAEINLDMASRSMKFTGRSAPNYKQVISLEGPETKGYYSIDTGNNGNILQGHYFERNAAHMRGDLHPMLRFGTPTFDQIKFEKLTLKPKENSKETQTDL